MKNKKKRILFSTILFILLIILAIPTIRVFFMDWFAEPIGIPEPNDSDSSCDLSKHHLKYNVKKGIQECVEGEPQ